MYALYKKGENRGRPLFGVVTTPNKIKSLSSKKIFSQKREIFIKIKTNYFIGGNL